MRSPLGKVIPFTKVFNDYRTGTRKKGHRAREYVCTDCPIRISCLGKSVQEKKFSVTYYREEYEGNNHIIKLILFVMAFQFDKTIL
jgi:hypothetical protein